MTLSDFLEINRTARILASDALQDGKHAVAIKSKIGGNFVVLTPAMYSLYTDRNLSMRDRQFLEKNINCKRVEVHTMKEVEVANG